LVFDATHSVQLPSASRGDEDEPAVSGGQPEFYPCVVAGGGWRRAWMACSWKYTTIPMRRKRRRECAGYAQPARVAEELQAVRKALDVAHATP